MILAQFEIPHLVKPKGNSRQPFMNPKTGKMMLPTPPKAAKNAENLASLCALLRPKEPFEGPLRVTYVYKSPWRKSDLQKRRRGKTVSNLRFTGSDLGNLDKQLDDVLQNCGFFKNDSQISSRGAGHGKRWADQGGVSVTIERDE